MGQILATFYSRKQFFSMLCPATRQYGYYSQFVKSRIESKPPSRCYKILLEREISSTSVLPPIESILMFTSFQVLTTDSLPHYCHAADPRHKRYYHRMYESRKWNQRIRFTITEQVIIFVKNCCVKSISWSFLTLLTRSCLVLIF